MRACAIVISYGREELCELLACWQRQTVSVPLVLCFDGVAPPTAQLPANVHQHALPAGLGTADSIGPVRAAAVQHARDLLNLNTHDAFICLEDDDYYHPEHAERTLATLRSASWTGARRIGLQRQRGRPPVLLEGQGGPGQQGAWGMRFGLYDEAGGYTSAKFEDVDLVHRIGARRCVSHQWCTHVRRQQGYGMSCHDHDRFGTREAARLAEVVRPEWSSELVELEAWCTRNLSAW